ncbi:NAP-domain-containing protein [Phellopilus nigrolimitatus]|nr:NAP-domain-containing protein [Phellopilus nigrolimitatus]
MSSNLPIHTSNIAAPTPQNTPLTHGPISSGLSRPNVPVIQEDAEGGEGDEVGVDDIAAALQSSAAQNVLAGIVQGRLNTLIGRSSGYIESLPIPVKRSLAALHGVQLKQADLQKEFKREVWELEKKASRRYLERTKPLYERRTAIISGVASPTSEEIEAGEAQALKDNDDYTPLPKDDTATAPIDEFWLTALRNHVGISELITDRDAGALKHLTDILISYLPPTEEKPGFKLSFIFSPNEYFEDTILEKTYFYRPEIDWSGDYVYERAIGTQIKWKEEKDLTKEVEVKKQRNKTTNRTRLVRKARPIDSFFNFFSPPKPPAEEAGENDEIDVDALEDIEGRLALDYQIGEDFKERIIPHAVDYFTGKALEFDAEDWEEDESDDDFDDAEDDDDDDDDV